MNSHTRLILSWSIGVAVCIAYMVYAWVPLTNDTLQVYQLDIGQGDAIYIRAPGGADILIDGGPDRSVLSQLGKVMPPLDQRIDMVIATHPDADHIAGLAELTDVYEIGLLVTNGASKETGVSRALSEWEQTYGIRTVEAMQGWSVELEPEVMLYFLHPNPQQRHEDVNEDSVVLLLEYRDFRALFTGDAGVEVERDLITYAAQTGLSLDVDLIKVGHHGSSTSTSDEWVSATSPQVGLIGVGVDNRYGHPHAGPLSILVRHHATIFRTDQHGRVRCDTDGTSLECTEDKGRFLQ